MQTLPGAVISRSWLKNCLRDCSRAIKRVRQFVPPATLHLIYKALIQPHFDYCNVVWGNCGIKLAARALTFSSKVYDANAFPWVPEGFFLLFVAKIERRSRDRDEREKKPLFPALHDRGFAAKFSPQTWTGKQTLWHPGYKCIAAIPKFIAKFVVSRCAFYIFWVFLFLHSSKRFS